MAAFSRERINDETVRKASNALLKWKQKQKLQSQSDHHEEEEEEDDDHQETETDDFIYLTVTLNKIPPKNQTLTPHRIPLRHSLLAGGDRSTLNFCLIVDGKEINSESANKILSAHKIPFVTRVLKLSKLKSEYKSFESKRTLYDSFDVFFAERSVVALLPSVLGKVFYRKKRKVPVPLDLIADGSNWKEEIETACKSSLLCLSSGTCSSVRVGRWGVTGSEEVVENVFEAVDGVLGIVKKKWSGIRCLHLKFSNSLALPVYESTNALRRDGNEVGRVGDGGFGLEGKKRKRA